MKWNNVSMQYYQIFDANKQMSENEIDFHGMQLLLEKITWFNDFQMQIQIKIKKSQQLQC